MKNISKLIVTGSLALSLLFYMKANKKPQEYMKYKNLPLIETADSLVNYVSRFYNYQERTDIPRTLENIKKNGGDCYDYSRLYKKMGKDLGFKTKFVKIKSSPKNEKKTYHRFTIMYDETGYIKLDMLNKSNKYKYGN